MMICAEAAEAASEIAEDLGLGESAREFITERIQAAFDKALCEAEEEAL